MAIEAITVARMSPPPWRRPVGAPFGAVGAPGVRGCTSCTMFFTRALLSRRRGGDPLGHAETRGSRAGIRGDFGCAGAQRLLREQPHASDAAALAAQRLRRAGAAAGEIGESVL